MMNSNPYAMYKQQDLETCGKEELVGKLFGTAALCLKMAVLSIGEKRYDKASSDMIKAQTIVVNLKNSLDTRYEVSKGLGSLYDYMLRRLVEANVKKDTEILNEVSGILFELRDTWNEAMKKARVTQKTEGAV